MKNKDNNKPFDSLMQAYLSNGTGTVSDRSDNEAEIVFNKEFAAVLPEDKVNKLIGTLSQSLSKQTLGSLIQDAIKTSSVSPEDLLTSSGLTGSTLEDIKADMVFANSIPVKSLIKLLKLLNVSLENAKAAIDVTFERLSAESKMFLTVPVKAQPAFRRGAANTGGGFDIMKLKSDESYLYQNKEALDKYTKRLSELYQEF